MSERFMRDLAYNYAEGTAAAWDRKMRQESADELRHERVSPDVYHPDDGHEFMEAMPLGWHCARCGSPKTMHTNQGAQQ